jgi:CRISPR-associated endoribonuclease Cas6
MLTSLILHLKSPTEANLPASLGRASQALLLRLIDARDPAWTQELHESNRPKPFTASNLVLGQRQAGSLHIQAGQTGWLRFTGLTEQASEHLLALAGPERPEKVDMDGHLLAVTGATLNPAEHPWAGQSSYQDLAAPFLLGGAGRLGRKIRLEFASPTTFRSGGRYLPLPLPELVFGSLLDRWQTFAPIALHPEARRFAEEAVVLSQYKLRTRSMPYKHGSAANGEPKNRGGWQIGFTGQVIFSVLNPDRYWLNVLHLLSVFAFYSGVGYQTGTGLGQVRVASTADERGSNSE